MQRAPQVVHGLDGLADVCVDPYGPTEERNTLPALLSNNMKKVRVQGVRSTPTVYAISCKQICFVDGTRHALQQPAN
jgi:hypothetical protein